jgi:hypothetical protein
MHSSVMNVENRLVIHTTSKHMLIRFTTKLVTLATLKGVTSRILNKAGYQIISNQYMKEMYIVVSAVARTFRQLTIWQITRKPFIWANVNLFVLLNLVANRLHKAVISKLISNQLTKEFVFLVWFVTNRSLIAPISNDTFHRFTKWLDISVLIVIRVLLQLAISPLTSRKNIQQFKLTKFQPPSTVFIATLLWRLSLSSALIIALIIVVMSEACSASIVCPETRFKNPIKRKSSRCRHFQQNSINTNNNNNNDEWKQTMIKRMTDVHFPNGEAESMTIFQLLSLSRDIIQSVTVIVVTPTI